MAERAAKRQKTETVGCRIGVIGFGKVGQFLVSKILDDGAKHGIKLAFVYDFYTEAVMNSELVPAECKIDSLDNFEQFKCDIICEVAHPNVTRDHGVRILKHCDYMIASTTTFANNETAKSIFAEADRETGHAVYLNAGALYGALDIKKMSDAGKLAKLGVTMKKHPDSLYPIKGTKEFQANEEAKQVEGEVVLYEGPVAGVAKTFPVNVNTICTAALAARTSVGMQGTTAKLVADSRLEEMIIEVKAEGPRKADGSPGLRITVLRENPSVRGAVTGTATLNSFYSSLKRVALSARGVDGMHLS